MRSRRPGRRRPWSERPGTGYYDDYKSPLAMPETRLYNDAKAAGLHAIAAAVLDGEFDATKEESDAWAASPEGQQAFRDLTGGR